MFLLITVIQCYYDFRIKGIYKVKKEIDVMKRNKLLLEHVIVSVKYTYTY